MVTGTIRGGPDGGGPWTSKRFVGAAVVVAVLVVLGLVLSLTNVFGGAPDQRAVPGPVPGDPLTTAAASPVPAGSASVCGLAGVGMSGTVAQAPDATWSLVGTTAAPAIKAVGPGRIDSDGYRSCYARTPVGALTAAANYLAIGSTGSLRKQFYERAPVPGPGRDALLRKPIPADGGSEGVRIQIVGFRVLRYNGEQADVDLAVQTSKGAYAGTVFNLLWSGGDWKVRIADDGEQLSPVVQIPDVNGYIPWAGA